MSKTYYQSKELEIWLEEGIAYAVHLPNTVISLEIAIKNVEERKRIFGGKTYPILIDVRKAKSMTKEAREYLASEEATIGISAGAFLIESSIEKFIINTWLSVFKPAVPSKVFRNKVNALEWLKYYRNLN